MSSTKTATSSYPVERRVRHAERPGFRITELQISPSQCIPWHSHDRVIDTFYPLVGRIRICVRDPEESIELAPHETYAVARGRPHQVENAGKESATFLVLQGGGEYNFVAQPGDALRPAS